MTIHKKIWPEFFEEGVGRNVLAQRRNREARSADYWD